MSGFFMRVTLPYLLCGVEWGSSFMWQHVVNLLVSFSQSANPA